MHRLPTGTFEMAPLDQFVVTAKNFLKKKMSWQEWYVTAGFPDYSLQDGHKLIFKNTREPADIEVVMPESTPPYELIWTKD